MTAVLSNNDSVIHNFSSGCPQIEGTNMGDFTLVSGGAKDSSSFYWFPRIRSTAVQWTMREAISGAKVRARKVSTNSYYSYGLSK